MSLYGSAGCSMLLCCLCSSHLCKATVLRTLATTVWSSTSTQLGAAVLSLGKWMACTGPGLTVASSAFLLPVCRRYVAMHPSYERMASLAYGALQQGTSLACPGTRLTLQAAAEAAAPWQKCEAVVWALEVRRRRAGGLGVALLGVCSMSSA